MERVERPSEIEHKKDIWAAALDLKRQAPNKQVESAIFLLGSSFSGKTSIILRFLDRDEPANPSIALEYTYGRRTVPETSLRQLCHIWELAEGGAGELSGLLSIPITSCSINSLSIVLVLDLSKPTELWLTWESCITALKSRINQVAQKCHREEVALLKSRATAPYGPDHPDKDLLAPLLTRFVIIGAKYDLFKEFPIEQRTVVCKTLRFLAHIHGATLQFFSTKSEGLCTRVRNLLSHLAFENPSKPSQTLSLDPNKPIIVPAGRDTLGQIGAPSFPGDHSFKADSSSIKTPSDLWKTAFVSYFSQEDKTHAPRQDPATDPKFLEPRIDAMFAKKQTELEDLIKEKATAKKNRKES